MTHKPDIDDEYFSWQILEDIIKEAYESPGSSFLETNACYGPDNLFSLIAKRIRLWVRDEHGDVFRLKKSRPREQHTAFGMRDIEKLKKYYKPYPLRVYNKNE